MSAKLRWLVHEFDRHVCSRALGASRYRTPEAVHMLAVIAMHESGLSLFQRDSLGMPIRGLARSPWQFERAGVLGLARHRARTSGADVLEALETGLGWQVRIAPEQVWERCAWDIVLACRLARALLWTVPHPLPRPVPDDEEEGWRQYLEAWRPGIRDSGARRRWRIVWRAIMEEDEA